jgi:penicillin-insensitive murein endopeptidase
MKRCYLLLITLIPISVPASAESVCFGSTGHGRLEAGVKLPGKGANFVSYGIVPRMVGRTYAHSKVRDVVLDAYRMLERLEPAKIYKYAETGFENGGRFEPHKTHQNGLSVDFMVPVLNSRGRSVPLPTNPINKYGYDIEFDDSGRYSDLEIDFDAMGAHLVALHQSAKRHGIGIRRVIFDPRLQSFLYASEHGSYIRENIRIPEKPSWVRHDEHYHVDFTVQCRTM